MGDDDDTKAAKAFVEIIAALIDSAIEYGRVQTEDKRKAVERILQAWKEDTP